MGVRIRGQCSSVSEQCTKSHAGRLALADAKKDPLFNSYFIRSTCLVNSKARQSPRSPFKQEPSVLAPGKHGYRKASRKVQNQGLTLHEA